MLEKDMVDEVDLCKKNVEYLLKIGNLLSNSCPPASRFYISNVEKRLHKFPDLLKNKSKSGMPLYCHHCGSIWNSTSCKVRTCSQQHLNSHIKKLLKMERTELWKLNNQQKKKLKRFYSSTSKIVYQCLVCRKRTIFPGSKTNSSSRTKCSTTSTPLPKLKLNKSDVNAGLFISSPSITNANEKINLNKSGISTNDSIKMYEKSFNLCNSFNLSSQRKESTSNLKQESSFSNFKVSPELSCKKQSSAKRKKTLLAQILDQEQNKKKKATLSSFLVSL